MITITRKSAQHLATTAGFDLRDAATGMVCTTAGMVGHESIVWTDIVGDPARHEAHNTTVYPIAG